MDSEIWGGRLLCHLLVSQTLKKLRVGAYFGMGAWSVFYSSFSLHIFHVYPISTNTFYEVLLFCQPQLMMGTKSLFSIECSFKIVLVSVLNADYNAPKSRIVKAVWKFMQERKSYDQFQPLLQCSFCWQILRMKKLCYSFLWKRIQWRLKSIYVKF